MLASRNSVGQPGVGKRSTASIWPRTLFDSSSWGLVRALPSKRKTFFFANNWLSTWSVRSTRDGRPTLLAYLWFFFLGSSHGKALWSASNRRPFSAGIGKAFACSGDGNRGREGGPACPLTFRN